MRNTYLTLFSVCAFAITGMFSAANAKTLCEVEDNPYDHGIRLASHMPASLTGASSPLGVFHNTIEKNESSRNGVAIEGSVAERQYLQYLRGD